MQTFKSASFKSASFKSNLNPSPSSRRVLPQTLVRSAFTPLQTFGWVERNLAHYPPTCEDFNYFNETTNLTIGEYPNMTTAEQIQTQRDLAGEHALLLSEAVYRRNVADGWVEPWFWSYTTNHNPDSAPYYYLLWRAGYDGGAILIMRRAGYEDGAVPIMKGRIDGCVKFLAT